MCDKVPYNTEKLAKTAMNFIRKNASKKRTTIPKRCYKCPDC